MARIKINAVAEVSPEQLARAFWGMSDEEQALFFRCLYHEMQESNAGEYGERQWYYLEKELNGHARSTLMAIAAPCFLNLCDQLEKKGIYY